MGAVETIIVIAIVVGVAGLGAIAFVLFGDQGQQTDIRSLMGAGGQRRDEYGNRLDFDVEEIKKLSGSSSSKSRKEDISTKLFRAGYFTAADRAKFQRIQIASPIISLVVATTAMVFFGNPLLITAGIVLGIFIGFAAPQSWLEREIRIREEDTLYYLPLVIEQISIGVSSSLDIGPCVAYIVVMAKERDNHNPVTEMFVHVEKLIRSGLNLEDSLTEVGEANGMTEVKHAFMFLAQCAKHGGEISKQLQELADSVMVQRQTVVEGRIAKLPVKATGPLAVVFAGFFALLMAGLFIRLLSAFDAT